MSRHYLINAILLGFGILIGYTLLSNPGQEKAVVEREGYATATQPDHLELIAVLRQQLSQEKQARELLGVKIQTLHNRLEELEHTRIVEAEPATVEPKQQKDTVAAVQTSVQALIDAGINSEQAIWLQERLDQSELQQLYLRDRATREGWLKTPRYYKERQQYQNTVTKLRDEVDDDVYDRLLYSLGRANRVVIKDIMKNSVAGEYGLQGGDSIIEYDGQRIFNSNELSSHITQGGVGVMTLIRVNRGGEIIDIYLPRGPLGIRMSAIRQMP